MYGTHHISVDALWVGLSTLGGVEATEQQKQKHACSSAVVRCTYVLLLLP